MQIHVSCRVFYNLAKTRSLRLPKFTFQPVLKFHFNYILRLFQPVWPGWKFQPSLRNRAGISDELKPSPCNGQLHFKRICFGSRAEISAPLTGLCLNKFEVKANDIDGRMYSTSCAILRWPYLCPSEGHKHGGGILNTVIFGKLVWQ